MENSELALTASNIKYLLVMNELSKATNGVRCVDMAEMLGVAKPSVHKMMNSLTQANLVHKDKYGKAFFTEDGKELAHQYSEFFEIMCVYFNNLLSKKTDVKTVVCTLLSQVSKDDLITICDKLKKER